MFTMVRICLPFVLCSLSTLMFAVAANAQGLMEARDTTAGAGVAGYTGMQTGTQSDNSQAMTVAPQLQGTYNPVFADSRDITLISGIDTAATVRVNNLANNEALLNIIANGLEIIGLAWGAHFGLLAFMHLAAGDERAKQKVLVAMAGTIGGFSAPGIINWMVASARDSNLFS